MTISFYVDQSSEYYIGLGWGTDSVHGVESSIGSVIVCTCDTSHHVVQALHSEVQEEPRPIMQVIFEFQRIPLADDRVLDFAPTFACVRNQFRQ